MERMISKVTQTLVSCLMLRYSRKHIVEILYELFHSCVITSQSGWACVSHTGRSKVKVPHTTTPKKAEPMILDGLCVCDYLSWLWLCSLVISERSRNTGWVSVTREHPCGRGGTLTTTALLVKTSHEHCYANDFSEDFLVFVQLCGSAHGDSRSCCGRKKKHKKNTRIYTNDKVNGLRMLWTWKLDDCSHVFVCVCVCVCVVLRVCAALSMYTHTRQGHRESYLGKNMFKTLHFSSVNPQRTVVCFCLFQHLLLLFYSNWSQCLVKTARTVAMIDQ